MRSRPKHPLEEGLEHINPVRARLLKVFGPADGWDNPLVGTQYDPAVRQKIEIERRHEREACREEHRRAPRTRPRRASRAGRALHPRRRLAAAPHGASVPPTGTAAVRSPL